MTNTQQGAVFDFDAMNFDDFTMAQQPYNGLKASAQGNTASGLNFFGDEGIDTTTGSTFDQQSFDTVFDPISTGFGMEQSLTLDNTSGSDSWVNINSSFPLTPVQSYDNIYTSTPQYNTGKRALQLDVLDFPQPKRHEVTALSYPTSASVTGSSWALDTQSTPASSTDVGLSDEAADVCATWFSKYNVLPSDRHIDSLSQLTGESPDAIRHWFGQALKQGMNGGHDSAYKSQTGFTQQQDALLFPLSENVSETLPQLTVGDTSCNHDVQATTTTTQGPLRGGKKGCNPTDDPELLKRDANKIYQCTRKCGKRYGRKCDWKRNEEEGYPSKSWICSLCVSQGVDRVKPCFRKYHFSQHFRNIHPGLNCADHEESSIVHSDTAFPKKCGFCPHRFVSRQDRIDHLAEHFKKGKCMLDWNDDDDDNHDSDNMDDDDDDRPDSGGFDNSTPFFPPNPNQEGGSSGSKPNGSSGSGYGGQQPPQGGYFQFSLAQSLGADALCDLQPNEHIIQRPSSCAPNERQRRTADTTQQQHERYVTAERDDAHALARNALTRPLIHQQEEVQHGPDQYLDNLPLESDIVKSIEAVPRTIPVDPPIEVDLLSEGGRATSSLPSVDPLRKSEPLDSQSFLSVKLLGTGGFSTVDEVVHRETSLRVSRKTLKNREQSALEELKKEVNVLQKLRHPHVIRFLGAYSKGDKMSILLSPVADTTLAEWLNRFSVDRPKGLANTIVQMLGCLASTVRYLHEQRPVVKHMDIKPQNILIMQGSQEFPHVVLSDFGISTIEDTAPSESKPLTRQYCAPEVSEGLSRGQAADIWSLGCVFAEMATTAFSDTNVHWLEFRKEFRGRDAKYYWQDVPSVHEWLGQFLYETKNGTEATVVKAVKSMLNPTPSERPSAAALTMVFTPAPCCLSWPNEKASYPGPLEELQSVEMLVPEDGIDCRAQLHMHAHADEKHLSEPFEHAKKWLDECSHDHDACLHQPNMAKSLPTRLIDIRPESTDGSFVRIVDSAKLESDPGKIDYVSLGHTWAHDELTLSTDRLSAMRTEVPKDLLPKAVNEAIATADRIGYRYLWVDSLCVVQDSDSDKERECLAMADVYRNSALTIVLGQPSSVLPNKADLYGSGKCSDNRHDPDGTSATTASTMCAPSSLTALHTIDFLTPGFAWDTRAWTLQERLLSRRLLHLGAEQMYWECNALKASETFPRGLPPLVWEKVHTRTTITTTTTTTTLTPNVAMACTGCGHAPHGDKPAIAAVSNVLATKVRETNERLRDRQYINKGMGSGDPCQAGKTQPGLSTATSHLADTIDNVKSKIRPTMEDAANTSYYVVHGASSGSLTNLDTVHDHHARTSTQRDSPLGNTDENLRTEDALNPSYYVKGASSGSLANANTNTTANTDVLQDLTQLSAEIDTLMGNARSTLPTELDTSLLLNLFDDNPEMPSVNKKPNTNTKKNLDQMTDRDVSQYGNESSGRNVNMNEIWGRNATILNGGDGAMDGVNAGQQVDDLK